MSRTRPVVFFTSMLVSGVLTLLLGVPAAAQQIPALEEVPRALPDPPRGSLDQRHTDLASRRNSLRARIQENDDRCRIYYSDSPEAKACPDATARLQADKAAYIAVAKAFNGDLEQAIAGEQNRLEKRIREMDEAIKHDAVVVRSLGFDRRAEDFHAWLTLSEEAHRKLSEALSAYLVKQGSEVLLKGIMEKLARIGPAKVSGYLEKLGLGNAASVQKLRSMSSIPVVEKEALNALAEQVFKDLQRTLLADEKYWQGQKLEALKKAIEFFAPKSLEGFFAQVKIGEVAVWATYDAVAQGVAVYEVTRLNKLTDQQLRALQRVHCVFERHGIDRYEAKSKLAALSGRDVADVAPPVQSRSCSK